MARRPEYYETVYRSYDQQNPEYKYAHYLAQITRFRGQAGGSEAGNLLDFGAARGGFLRYCRRFLPDTELHGLDVNQSAVAEARELLPELCPEQLQVGDFRALASFPAMNVITSFDVLEHVPELEEALDALVARLLPGGLLVAVVPVYDGPLGPLVHLLDRDPTHVHKRGRDFWLEQLSARFELVHWHGILRYLLPGGVYLHLPSQWARRVTPAILMVARKG